MVQYHRKNQQIPRICEIPIPHLEFKHVFGSFFYRPLSLIPNLEDKTIRLFSLLRETNLSNAKQSYCFAFHIGNQLKGVYRIIPLPRFNHSGFRTSLKSTHENGKLNLVNNDVNHKPTFKNEMETMKSINLNVVKHDLYMFKKSELYGQEECYIYIWNSLSNTIKGQTSLI